MENLVTIKSFSFPHEAHILKTKLEDGGIACFIKDEVTIQVIGFYSNALGGVRLQVMEKDVEKALAIIKAK